jgi:hypothetical protein
MAKVDPTKLKNGDLITVNGSDYVVMYVKSEGDRIRIHTLNGSSLSVPKENKVTKK